MNWWQMGKDSIFFFFCMLIFSGHVCILRAGYWHFMWTGKFILYLWWFLLKKSIQVAFGECAIHETCKCHLSTCVLSNILLPLPNPFFSYDFAHWLFHTFQRRKRTVRSGAKDKLLKQDYLLHSQKTHFNPSLSPPKANTSVCCKQCLKLIE